MTSGLKSQLDPVRFGLTLLGVGAIAYPLFWMLAGLRAPGLGSTAAAKESLRWLALPSVGALVAGGVIVFALVITDLFVGRARHAR